MKNKSHGNLLSGLLIGAAVGTAYSMLFAQKKGKDLRGELQKQIQDPKKALGTVLEQYKDAGAESTQLAKEFIKKPEVKEALSQLQTILEPLLTQVQEKGDMVAKIVRDYVGKGEQSAAVTSVKKVAPKKAAPAKKSSATK